MARYGVQQDAKLEAMDSPAHVFEAGGVNGRSGIRGVPVRSESSERGLKKEGRRIGIMSEPIAVLLRDAVSIDTAVRLTGAERITLQLAVVKGYLPSLKLGGSTSPYLVRVRDVIAYIARINAMGMQRGRGFVAGRDFVGFPPWLVERVRGTDRGRAGATRGTPYASEVVAHDQGG